MGFQNDDQGSSPFSWVEADLPKEEEGEEFQLLNEIVDDQWIERNVIYVCLGVCVCVCVCVLHRVVAEWQEREETMTQLTFS